MTQNHGHMKSLWSFETLWSPPLFKEGHFFSLVNTNIYIHFLIYVAIRNNLVQTLWCLNVILDNLTEPKFQLAGLGYINLIQEEHVRPNLLCISGLVLMCTLILVQTFWLFEAIYLGKMAKNWVHTPKKGEGKHFLGKSYWEKFS